MFIRLPRRARTPVVNSLRIRLAGIVVVLGGLLMPPGAPPNTPAAPPAPAPTNGPAGVAGGGGG
ncbi:MAG: hypothetical protein ACTHOH_19170, partial [Lysobacteraceae bacterium]